MKILSRFADKLALRIFNLIKADADLRDKLVGPTGCMGMMGRPADELFKQWQEEQNKPEATIEDFIEWFKVAIKTVKE